MLAGKSADDLTLELLSTAGITGAIEANLDAYKTEIESLTRADLDETKSIQKVIDYINKEEAAIDVIAAYAKSKNTSSMTIEQIKATGVSSVIAANIEAYKVAVKASNEEDLDTKEEIQDMVDEVKNKIDVIKGYADNDDASELETAQLVDIG